MAEMQLFGKTVQVYDTGQVSRKISLGVALDAVLWYVEQFSDAELAKVKATVDYENLCRSILIKSQTHP